MKLIVELPSRKEQIRFNRLRWQEVLKDRELGQLPYRIETNAHGQVIMNPPASGGHSHRQSRILLRISSLLGGNPLAECPVSTIDGVKAIDVAWYSNQRYSSVQGQDVFELAPEICVEVISPSNTRSEMIRKKSLYFEAGAVEVWFCQTNGMLEFFSKSEPDEQIQASTLCPDFPQRIE